MKKSILFLTLLSLAGRCCKFGPKINVQRIIGGHPVKDNKYKFMAAIIFNKKLLCGGAILNKNTILTAAHCLEHDPLKFIIYVGHANIKRLNKHYIFKVSMAVSHPEYDDSKIQNDIAVLKLDRNINFLLLQGTVAPVYLVNMYTEEESNKLRTLRCYTMGWGRTEKNKSSQILNELMVPVLSDHVCARLSRAFHMKSQLCAGYLEGGRDSCFGDSGGPLVCRSNNEYGFRLYGLVSYGDGCALENHPGYYTRVSAYLDWIQMYIHI